MRTSQRGFAFLGLTIIEMVVYSVMALAGIALVAGVWHSINSTLEHHYADPVRAKLEPKIAALTTDNKNCTDANASLAKQFADFRKAHNDEIQLKNDEYEALKAKKAKNKAAIAPKVAEIQWEKFNAVAAAQAAGLTCDEMDAVLLKEAERKQRYYGPATETAPQGGVRIIEPTKKTP